MGATGHSIFSYSRTGVVSGTYGIPGAMVYTGRVPDVDGFEKVGGNRLTLKLTDNNSRDIILTQFRLTKDRHSIVLSVFKSGRKPISQTIKLNAYEPSLQETLNYGNGSDKVKAYRILSVVGGRISDEALFNIAQHLKEK